jgi:hypothetical protein
MSNLNEVPPSEWDQLRTNYFKNKRPSQEFNDYANECALAGTIDKPAHYNNGSIEAIEYIKQQTGEGFKDYLYGSAMKYLHRHRYKGKPVDDLRKAQWFINRLIQEECHVN